MTKKEFFAREKKCFFVDDPAEAAAYCQEHWQRECKHIIRMASAVCRNEFLFDLPHDLEQTWEPVCFEPEGLVDWEYRPDSDPEFSYQFNRHRFFICLGQAYWLTKDETYVKHFLRLLTDWMERMRRTPETEKTGWRILEAGFRGEYWTKAIRYFEDSPLLTDSIIDKFYHCLIEHAEYIIEMHTPYRYISNWGVLENHGLFEIGIAMPDEERRIRYTSAAMEHLEIQARMQILGDGVQWEQSPMYHNEVLHCFEDVLILADRNRIPVPEAFFEAVKKMAYVDLMWQKPDGREFMMGDSDDMDIRDYLGVAAWLFQDPVLKTGGQQVLDYESVWDIGAAGAREYERMEMVKPGFTSAALEDSGNYYLRSGWEPDSNVLHFHCGTMGAGHGHSDKLHMDLVVRGEDVLTDSGRYTYAVDKGRFDFKNPEAHNTLTVDGKYFTVCKDSWECSKLCQPVKQPYRFTKPYEFVQGGHLGYMDMPGGVFVNRKIIWIKPDLYVIMDELYSEASHSYEQYWNFSERGQVSLSEPYPVKVPRLPGPESAENPDPTIHRNEWKLAGDKARVACKAGQEVSKPMETEDIGTRAVQTADFIGEKAQARFFFLTPKSGAEVVPGRIARHYNQQRIRQIIRVSIRVQGFTSLLTVIQTGESGKMPECQVKKLPVKSALKGIYYPSSMAEGLKIVADRKEYVVIICHQEVNSPTDLVEVDGCLGYGNVIVFDKGETDKVGAVLCW